MGSNLQIMYKSIKLNKDFWQTKVPFKRGVVSNPLQVFSDDEEKFSAAMKSFRIGQITKHTKYNRHEKTQDFLKKWSSENLINPVILDIGASDGITSLELMNNMGNSFKRYFITDYNLKCTYIKKGNRTYFFNQADNCFLIATPKFVFYPNDKWFFDLFFKKIINRLKKASREELLLINKKLQKKSESDSRIKILPYNVLEPWNMEKADILIVGNLLQRGYFTDAEIVKGIINCYNALKEYSILIIVRNEATKSADEIERSSIYLKQGSINKMELLTHINGGIEIHDLIISLTF